MTDEPMPDAMVEMVERMAASMNMAAALEVYIRVFGIEEAGTYLTATVEVLRRRVKYRKIMNRIREIRSGMAAAAQARGDWQAPDVEDPFADVPTPEYPGWQKDDAWLRKNCGFGVKDVGHEPRSAESPDV